VKPDFEKEAKEFLVQYIKDKVESLEYKLIEDGLTEILATILQQSYKAGMLRSMEKVIDMLKCYHPEHQAGFDFVVKLRNEEPYFHYDCFLCDNIKLMIETFEKAIKHETEKLYDSK
jgi:hypothetical protein